MQQQPRAIGGEKILLHMRQEAKLRFHSLLRHGLCHDLHLYMIYGTKRKQDVMEELGKSRSGLWFPGRLQKAALVGDGPRVWGSVMHRVCWS